MNHRFITDSNLLLLVSVFTSCGSAPQARAAEASAPTPSGVIEFAGRVARNHWYLFGPEKRAELEAINRELRNAGQEADKATSEETRGAASRQAAVAARRLLEQVRACPRIIRVDLTAARPALVPPGPFELPGDTGAFLFEVVATGDGLSYATSRFDFSPPPALSSLVTLDVATNGTTYAVAGLEHVPFGRTTVEIEFRRAGQPAVRLPIDVTTPGPGRLKLTVLSEDTGKPMPAMVRLIWRTDGLVRQPGNGIDFEPQFERQVKASGARAVTLTGSPGEPFWCVPGPVDMALTPGAWQIGLRHGVEHEAFSRK